MTGKIYRFKIHTPEYQQVSLEKLLILNRTRHRPLSRPELRSAFREMMLDIKSPTSERVANLIGISGTTLGALLRGKRPITQEISNRVLDALVRAKTMRR